MRRRRRFRWTILWAAGVLAVSPSALGQELARPQSPWFVAGGYGHTISWGASHSQVDMLAVTPEWNRPIGRHFDYVIGAHIARTLEPDGLIAGLIPLGVLVWPSRNLPYWRMGAGFGWTDLTKLQEIGRRFNFLLQMGLGARWETKTFGRWTTELRFLHISNANTAPRNGGLNSLHLLVGRSF